MITVVSPSKTQVFSGNNSFCSTMPRQLINTQKLINLLKKYSAKDLAKFMTISHKLAELNYKRIQNFQLPFNKDNAKQAIFAFRGTVYNELDINNYSEADFNFAQNNMRILSGLYGVLKPLDLIQPYRLEMGVKLANKHGVNLYKFWGDDVSTMLNKDNSEVLVNLASNEYFKSVNKKLLTAQVLQIDFKELLANGYKTIGFYAKRARGLMLNYIIKKRIINYHKLKNFNARAYEFNKKLSNEYCWVFTR